MDIDLLKSFIAICETGSFTQAARQVGRTQSAVSLQIRRLEALLGRPLLSRLGGNVQLTDHGELFLGYAKDIVASYGAALAAFNRGSVEGVVVLGLSEHYAPRILSDVLRSFIELYPLATVDLVPEESMVLAKGLSDGAIDLAFITEGIGPVRGGPVVFRDEIVWVAPLTGTIHEKDPLPIAIRGEDDSYAQAMVAALEAMKRAHRIAVISRSITGLRAAVSGGLAVSAMVRSAVTADMRELTPREGFPPLGKFNIRLERSHLKKSPIIDRLEAHLIARLSEEPAS
ncbi:LysR family transcriptional regulator [Taklimakanibacter deserti]|uniref:LysR family transcriptional regulator n=1 Tax=Taklimakanibacter deserti TaxID=2267839 RepID=UPI000E6544EE